MLCKRTMRAALAPVVGLIGLLGATMVSAQDDEVDVVIASQLVADVTGTVTIASESLAGGTGNVTEGHYHVNTASGTAATVRNCAARDGMPSTGDGSNNNPKCAQGKPDSWLELQSEVDILLSNRGTSEHYYVRYDFTGMVFSEAPPKPEVVVPYSLDLDSDPATPATTTKGYLVDKDAIVVAYRGREGDANVIFRLPIDPSDGAVGQACYDGDPLPDGGFNQVCAAPVDENADDYLVGTRITLLLPHHLAVAAAREATYGVTVKVFEDLSEAKENEAHGTNVYSATGDVIKLAPAIAPADITAMLAIAEVSTPEDEGGAFRLFVDGDDDGMDADMYANLASVEVELVDNPGLNAAGGLVPVTDAIIAGVTANATSDQAGAFGFGSSSSFRISAAGCGAGGLTLMKPDDDGDPTALEMGDSLNVATSASGAGMKGMSYFCVMVGPHTPNADMPVHRQAIPEVGDPTMMNGYMLAVTPTIAATAPMAVHPPAGMAMAAGSIDRNGTTVHISYLSGSANANQRLVIVNRGSDAARFWMSDFQSEGGQDVTHSGGMMLAQGTMSEVPGGGRVVIRVQDNLSFSARPPRTAGTLTVAGPTRNIDVMTVQVVGGTLDTTVYQHAE